MSIKVKPNSSHFTPCSSTMYVGDFAVMLFIIYFYVLLENEFYV